MSKTASKYRSKFVGDHEEGQAILKQLQKSVQAGLANTPGLATEILGEAMKAHPPGRAEEKTKFIRPSPFRRKRR